MAPFDGSVTWTSPPESCHASHVSTVPNARSRSRAPGVLARIQASLVADWLGASVMSCSARMTRHSPTVRRSCQPRAGAIGSPVSRSHTIVLARWLVIPTALIGSPAAAMASAAASRTRRASSAASNSTSPGNGVAGGNGRRAIARIARSPSTMAARMLVVPTSRARIAVIGGPPALRGMTPRLRSFCPSRPPTRPAPSTTLRLNISANHRTSSPRIRRMVANTAWATTYVPTAVTMPWDERRAGALHPGGAAGTEDEAEHGAEAEPDGQRAGVVPIGGPAGGDRERHGEHEGDAARRRGWRPSPSAP